MPGLNRDADPPQQGADRRNWRDNNQIRLILERPRLDQQVPRARSPAPAEQVPARPNHLDLNAPPRIQGQASLIIDLQDVLNEVHYIVDRATYTQRLLRTVINNITHRPVPPPRQNRPEA
jgi:hypothetical protein